MKNTSTILPIAFCWACLLILSPLFIGAESSNGNSDGGQKTAPAKSAEGMDSSVYQQKKNALALLDKADENGFSVKGHLDFAQWCMDNKMTQAAARELVKILEFDPRNDTAKQYLDKLDYVLYEGEWITRAARQELVDKQVQLLLKQLKSKNESERSSAMDDLSDIDIADKFTLLSKHINDPDEKIRTYMIESMAQIKPHQMKLIISVMPQLVKASLEDESEKVRQLAFNTATNLHREIALHNYGVWAYQNDNPTRNLAVDALKQIANAAPELSNVQKDYLDYYLLATMQRLTIIINARQIADRGSRTVTLRTDVNPPGISTSIVVDLPWTRSLGVSTVITMPAGMNFELAGGQLGYIGKTMESLTDQKFGNDYSKWLAWWNEHNKPNKQKN